MKTKSLVLLLMVSITVVGIALGVSGCVRGGTGQETDITTASAAGDRISIVSAGVSEYKIIRPEEGHTAEVAEAVTFRKAIQAVTGCEMSIGTDWYQNESEIGALEILFGSTTRPESQTALADLAGLQPEEYAFIVRMDNGKLVIAGSSASMLARAVAYISENFLTPTGLEVPADLDFTSEIFTPTPADYISGKGKLAVEMDKIGTVSPVGNCNVLQGGCTDGEFLYIVMNDGASSGALSAIVKIDPNTGKAVKTVTGLQIDHGNDLCYNSKTNRIVAVHNAPYRQKVSFFDADTLEFIETVTLTQEIYSIAYDESEDCYWVGISYGYNFSRLNADMSIEKVCAGYDSGFTKQGMDIDDDYIYFVMYNTNCIAVYDWNGNYIRQIDLPVTSGEPENICHIGDVFYISYNNASWTGAIIYTATLHPAADAQTTSD